MDCEKFDRILLDLLYDELDELTAAAAKRHMDQCSRCRPIAMELKATREVGVLPLVDAPDELEQRILEAERSARRSLPLGQRLGRAVSVLAGYAMRPQLAMAALLLLMIGSSLLLIRAKPGETEAISVTERGVPESEGASVAIIPAAPIAAEEQAVEAKRSASDESSDDQRLVAQKTKQPGDSPEEKPKAEEPDAPGGGSATDDTFELAMSEYRNGNWVAAQTGFDRIETRGGANAAQAALFSAQAVRNAAGCTTAAPKFETVSVRYRSSAIASDARWQAADCFRATGQMDRARKHYQALLGQPGYDTRARKALAQMDEAAPRPAAEAAPPKAAAKPAVTGSSNDAL